MLIKPFVTPNEQPSKTVPLIFAISVFFLGWQVLRPTIFPSPLEVVLAIPNLWSDGIWTEMLSSLEVNLEALVLSALIGLPIAYLSRVPLIRPLAQGLSKLRFVGSAVFFLPLMLVLNSGHEVKVALLTLGELFYLVTTMMGVVISIPEFKFDHARTLRMSEWLSIWYVVVRGTIGEALDAIRDNAAMGWSMLMFVEGVVRSEGGVGVVIMNAEKHTDYNEFFAVVLMIILVGIGQDWLIGQLKKVVCPYAS